MSFQSDVRQNRGEYYVGDRPPRLSSASALPQQHTFPGSFFRLSNGVVYRTLYPESFQELSKDDEGYVTITDQGLVRRIQPHAPQFIHPPGHAFTRAYHVYDANGAVGLVDGRKIHITESRVSAE